MIRQFTFENFKSFRDATLRFSPLTLLVGPNASGKSNAVEGVQLLSWMASGRRLGDFLHAVKDEKLGVRGTLENLFWEPGQPLRLGASIDWPDGPGPLKLSLGLALVDGNLRIVEESLVCPQESNVPLYEIVAPAKRYGQEILVAYNNFARGGRKPRIEAVDQRPVFTQLETPSRFGSKHKKTRKLIPEACKTVAKTLDSILFLDPSPRQMRDYSFPADRVLQGDGENLSAVLSHLIREQGQEEAILQFVRSLPEQDIEGIDFLEGPRGEVMVQLDETFGGKPQKREAAVLSDGTLRILSVAAAVLSVPEGSLVVIEEIDNGVHPSRAHLLLENLQRIAEERELVILLTTHNPALHDAVPRSSVPRVVACFRDPESGESRLVRLEELDRYPNLVARGSLGSLTTRGILDEFLKDRTSPEERKRQELEWIEELRTSVAVD